MKQRTPQEIERMKKALLLQKEKLPQYSIFGDDNHLLIDTQIEILEGKILDEYEIYNREEEFGEGKASDICMIFDWLNGSFDDEEIVDEEILEEIDDTNSQTQSCSSKMKVCTKICNECPFSNKSLPGWLADYTVEDIKNYQRHDALFPCHLMIKGDQFTQEEVSKAIEAGEMKLCRGYIESIIKSAKMPKKGTALYEAYEVVKKQGLSENSISMWDFEKHHTQFKNVNKKSE